MVIADMGCARIENNQKGLESLRKEEEAAADSTETPHIYVQGDEGGGEKRERMKREKLYL